MAKALSLNLPITVVNHADAPHVFDLDHDSETTRQIIRHILAFLQSAVRHSGYHGGHG